MKMTMFFLFFCVFSEYLGAMNYAKDQSSFVTLDFSQKTTRASRACTVCRARRVKCDGDKPCGPCIEAIRDGLQIKGKKIKDCVYDIPKKRGRKSNNEAAKKSGRDPILSYVPRKEKHKEAVTTDEINNICKPSEKDENNDEDTKIPNEEEDGKVTEFHHLNEVFKTHRKKKKK